MADCCINHCLSIIVKVLKSLWSVRWAWRPSIQMVGSWFSFILVFIFCIMFQCFSINIHLKFCSVALLNIFASCHSNSFNRGCREERLQFLDSSSLNVLACNTCSCLPTWKYSKTKKVLALTNSVMFIMDTLLLWDTKLKKVQKITLYVF